MNICKAYWKKSVKAGKNLINDIILLQIGEKKPILSEEPTGVGGGSDRPYPPPSIRRCAQRILIPTTATTTTTTKKVSETERLKR